MSGLLRAVVLARAEKTENCWLWQGNRDKDGYGRFTYHGKYYKAHRAAYMAFKGAIPDGLCVIHSCDNPPCVNPDHLFVGTNADNIMDRQAKGRQAKGVDWVPRARRVRGERQHLAKITAEIAVEIAWRSGRGESDVEIARSIGISRDIVYGVRVGRTWKHVTAQLFTAPEAK